MTNNAELVKINGKKLQKQLEDRRKSRVMADTNIHAAVEGYEKRLKDLAEENDELEEEVFVILKILKKYLKKLSCVSNINNVLK